MKYFFLVFFSLFIFSVNATSFKYKIIGKVVEDNIINFPSGGKFVSFHHLGGFETDIGKYGEYQCRGSILYNKKDKLENIYWACENKDQEGDRFINMGKRFKGSDIDRAVGMMSIIEAEGFWKSYLGYKCTYAVEYVDKVIFSTAQCKK